MVDRFRTMADTSNTVNNSLAHLGDGAREAHVRLMEAADAVCAFAAAANSTASPRASGLAIARAIRYSSRVEQHTLSKFYITGFYDSAEKPSKNPPVWYLPLDEPPPRRWRRERARDISARTDYYNLANAPPERRLELENLFASVEDAAAGPLRTLARGEVPKDLGAVSLFIALTLARPPGVVEGFARLSGRLVSWPDTSYPARAQNRPDVVASSAAILEIALEDLVPRLARMTWGVWQTTEDVPFIASDTPVAFNRPGEGYGVVENLDHPKFELSMPLSKTAALVLYRPGSGPLMVVHRAVPDAVLEMNLRTAANAASFLIASSTSFPGVDELAR